MKLNKLLIASSIVVPAAISPIGLMTSCSNTWGKKSPLSIGACERNNENNPYYAFREETYQDIDGLYIPSYLQSNYIVDNVNSVNYGYSMPVDKWYETKDGKSNKLSTDQWTDGSAVWLNPSSSSITTSITTHKTVEGKEYQLTESCAKNLTLTANVSFVTTIGSFINKFLSYAINYATSQVQNDADFAVAWGGKAPSTTDATKRTLYEWMYANSNAHASGKTDAYLRTTNANFNFVKNNFPIVSYVDSDGKAGESKKMVAPITRQLLTSNPNSELGDTAPTIYWSESKTQGDGDNKYTVYTYPSVPVLIRTKDVVQRYINPQTDTSIFVSDYYQNNKDTVVNAVGNSWNKMGEKDSSWLEPVDPLKPEGEKRVKPSFYKYDVKTHGKDAKALTYAQPQQNEVDARIKALNPLGSDFIAFVTYSYVKWDKPNSDLDRNNTVTLSSLQTIMPAFLLELKPDLFTKIKSDKDNSGYMVDTTKADKYTNELINLLSRNSDQGRVAKASDLNEDSKNYLKFLSYMFSNKDSSELTFDFVEATKF